MTVGPGLSLAFSESAYLSLPLAHLPPESRITIKPLKIAIG
jgi:hypothetical protein